MFSITLDQAYQVLGLKYEKGVEPTQQEVERSYRTVMSSVHPDFVPSYLLESIQEVNAIFNVARETIYQARGWQK